MRPDLLFKRFASILAVWAVLGCFATHARAGSNPAAEALFQEAKKAMDKGDYETACRQFAESDRLEAAPGTKMNQANCEEQRGHIATAWALYKSALSGLDSDDKRHAFAKSKVEKLEPRVPKVTLIPTGGTPPSDLVVEVAGQKFTSSGFNIPIPVDPGTHTVIVSARGFQPQKAQLELAEGEQRDFRFAVAGQPAAAAPAPASAAPEPKAAPASSPAQEPVETDTGAKSGSGLRTFGFILGGVGIAGLAAGGVLGALVIQRKNTANDNCWEPTEDYPEGGCYPAGDDANREGAQLAPYTTVALAVGGAALVSGIVIILASPSGDESAKSRAATSQSMAALQPTAGGAKLTWTTTF